MKYPIIITEADEGGFWAEVPQLPGCVSQGETIAELKTNLRQAIAGYLETLDQTQLATCKRRVTIDEVMV